MASDATRAPCRGENQWMVMSNSSSASTIALTHGILTACWPCSPMMSPGPTVWMVATFMGAKQYASTGRASDVEPVRFYRTADGAMIAEVRQTVRDPEGKPPPGQTHGLNDQTVGQVSRLQDGKVPRFDIQDAA